MAMERKNILPRCLATAGTVFVANCALNSDAFLQPLGPPREMTLSQGSVGEQSQRATSSWQPLPLSVVPTGAVLAVAAARSTKRRGRAARSAVAEPKAAEPKVAEPTLAEMNVVDAADLAEPEEELPAPFDPSQQVGAMEPLGYFDPLGFAKVGDEKGWRRLRSAEIKHGRLAMMASIGAVGQHFIKFPGFEKCTGTFAAALKNPAFGATVFFIAPLCAILELAWRESEDREPGNYGDPLGFDMYTTEMRNKELNNGRMAMISVLGIFAAEVATGKDAIEQFGF